VKREGDDEREKKLPLFLAFFSFFGIHIFFDYGFSDYSFSLCSFLLLVFVCFFVVFFLNGDLFILISGDFAILD